MEVRKIPIEQLRPAKYNPRKDLKPGDPEYDKLARSMSEFGYVEPIIWNERTGNIVGGHQRFKVLKSQGVDAVDCVVVDMDEAKEKTLNVALNKISGDWDNDALSSLFFDLNTLGVDILNTGFDEKEINELLHSIASIEDDDFDVDAALPEVPISQPGDLWLLGRHRLVCGDSTKAETFAALMDDRKATLVVTDPPYNVDYKGTAGKIMNDNMTDDAFYRFLLDAFKNMYTHADPGAAIYVFHADSEGLNFRKAYQDAGFMMKQCLIWVKNSLVLGRQDYQWRHEPILYGWKDGAAHYFIDDRSQTTVIDDSSRPNFKKMKKEELLEFITEFFDNLDKTPQSIIYCDKPSRNEDHPTMKPIPLLAYLIMNSSMSNTLVLDPFGGSGSTLIACEQTERVCRMIELDPKYCDVIIARWESATGKKAVRENV